MRIFQGGAAIIVLAALLAACQTVKQAEIPKYTQWRPMLEEQSEIRFVGAHKPRISSMQTRWLDEWVQEERIYLETDTRVESSKIRVFFSSVAFSERVSAEFRHPGKTWLDAVDRCSGAEIGESVESANANGTFRYVPCRYVGGDLCILAKQGIREVKVQGPEPNYFILADFLYCSANETEEQILDRFASLRIGE